MISQASKKLHYVSRDPGEDVKRKLRKEVGFSCPAPSLNGTGRCANPYLTWHHFDPPWKVAQHHNPSGMIALCQAHHDKADAGAYTRVQLRRYKEQESNGIVGARGKIDWMRRDLLFVIGSNFFQWTPIILRYEKTPLVWFERDWQGYFLLNINLLPLSALPGFQMKNNVWQILNGPVDFKSPPSGKEISVKYEGGNSLHVDFYEIESPEKLQLKYSIESLGPRVSFPLTSVEFQMEIKELNLKFGSKKMGFLGGYMEHVLMRNFDAAITLYKNGFGMGSVTATMAGQSIASDS